MTTRKPHTLRKRYNADGSVTLYARGKAVQRFEGVYALQHVADFAKGWYGDHPVIWGRTMFAKREAA